MPGISGEELVSRIRDQGEWLQPKIVMASSMGAPPDTALAYDAFLVKPVRRSVLLERLSAVVSGSVVAIATATALAPLQLDAAAGVQARVLLAEDFLG